MGRGLCGGDAEGLGQCGKGGCGHAPCPWAPFLLAEPLNSPSTLGEVWKNLLSCCR